MLVSSDDGETRVAILDNGQATELYFDRKFKQSIVGNIYVGKVENILPSLDAALSINSYCSGLLKANLKSTIDNTGNPPSKAGLTTK